MGRRHCGCASRSGARSSQNLLHANIQRRRRSGGQSVSAKSAGLSWRPLDRLFGARGRHGRSHCSASARPRSGALLEQSSGGAQRRDTVRSHCAARQRRRPGARDRQPIVYSQYLTRNMRNNYRKGTFFYDKWEDVNGQAGAVASGQCPSGRLSLRWDAASGNRAGRIGGEPSGTHPGRAIIGTWIPLRAIPVLIMALCAMACPRPATSQVDRAGGAARAYRQARVNSTPYHHP